MKREEIVSFATNNVEPLRDGIYGDRYRVAAHLTDGTYLPCVVLQSKKARLQLALRRFKELRRDPSQYNMVVESFVSSGSHVADYDLRDVELSPFAWPVRLLEAIHGETSMGWTAFAVEMRDGTMYSYGTAFRFEFFDLPNGYSHSDITKIHSGMIYSKSGGLEPHNSKAREEIHPFREKPFFTCYLGAPMLADDCLG